MNPSEVIVRPVITEKATELKDEEHTLCFHVHLKANSHQVKRAVEELFDVKVDKVRILRMPGKLKRLGRSAGYTPEWKKAYVKLAAGEKMIEYFEGV